MAALGRRTGLVLASLALLAAACGGGSEGAGPGRPDASTTTGAGAPPAGGIDDPTSTTTTGGGGPPVTADGLADDGGQPPSATDGSEEGNVLPVGSGRVGQLGPALLRPGRGDRVVVEVRAQAGASPRGETLDHLVDVLRSASGKEVGVDGVDQLLGTGKDWSARDIVDAAASMAQIESGRAQVVLRLLFLRGTFEGDTGVLGVAVAGDVAAVFVDQIDSAAGLLVDPAVVEDAVSVHEVGHLLGLVDLVLGTGRGDPDHPGHSRNRRSVMYWQVESDLVVQLLEGGIPRDFDSDDRAELAAIRAG